MKINTKGETKMSTIDIVTGAQYGSEGKGHVTAQLIHKYNQPGHKVTNIRVAGPNAGHTVIDQGGMAHPLRTIPVGAAIHPDADLYIAPGSEIDLDVFRQEILNLRQAGHPVKNLYVSGEATLLTQKHKDHETQLAMHENIGSTGKGIGSARADRIMRTAERVIDNWEARTLITSMKAQILTAPEHLLFMANQLNQPNRHIVIEGTQGYGLGLHAGKYPQCTSSDTRAIDFLSMAGISPWAPGVERVTPWLVARIYPIRVAGNSGPLENETTWEQLGLPEEKTTVTHKVRRVGEWDSRLIREAAMGNGIATHKYQLQIPSYDAPGRVALTMVDQKIPQIHGLTHLDDADEDTQTAVWELIGEVEHNAGARVGMFTTSPDTCIWND
jgi:adenylosuccinate synthase